MADSPEVRSLHTWPARDGDAGDWPDWVPPVVREAAARQGIERPWRHQAKAAEAAHAGRHVALATPTASGKTLAYLLPILAATATPPSPASAAASGRSALVGVGTVGRSAPAIREALRPTRPATALYLSPTKALAHDQLRVCGEWNLPSWRVTAVDGDSEPEVRDWAREHATYVLTNPDLLHCSVLPGHARWAGFLSALRYVVLDEAHRYSGIFGAQVAAVLRRLRRLCASYGASPVFLLASATTANARAAAAALVGVTPEEVTLVDEDTSPRGPRTLALWEPVGTAEEDAARLLAGLVARGHQTVAFTGSRRAAETVALGAAHQVAARGDRGALRIEAYRGGYLAADRRRLERALQTRTLHGVAATNALELGVDLTGVDAVVMAGFPGSRAAFWQQAGRAGRGCSDALVVLVARRQPLDAYLLDHPEAWLTAPVEATVLHPENPYVLGPHLAAAAQELPLTLADAQWFGAGLGVLLRRLEDQQVLRRRPHGWYWTRPERAVDAIHLRTTGSGVAIVEADTGRVLGDVDPVAADAAVHPGAVYLHQGETYLVEELDAAAGEALVRPAAPGYLTQPRTRTGVTVLSVQHSRRLGAGVLAFGEVEVTRQVTGFLRRDPVTGTVWDETPLDLPARTLRTSSCWWSLNPALVEEAWSSARLEGAVHAVEHVALLLLPLFAPCDRWDITGHSDAAHPDTGGPTVFVSDTQPGGAGFAERAYAVAEAWLGAALERLERCPCAGGCPACVISPGCGRGNLALDGDAARRVLRQLVEPPRVAAAFSPDPGRSGATISAR
ncbi:MAG: DEAD/DEAH box helicase [Actinomycetes bacterium]